MLARQFLVKAILTAIRRNQDVTPEILSSRIADQVEIANEVFESNDDPMPVPEARVREIYSGNAPSTPEDLGQVQTAKKRSFTELPQPSLIVAPDSREAKETWEKRETRTVQPIRPMRAAPAEELQGEHENWEFQELFAEVIANCPETFELTPDNQTAPVSLDRSFQSDAGSGIITLTYTLKDQRDSAPSTPDTQSSPITIPIQVGTSFNRFMPRSIDFVEAVDHLKLMAIKAFAPRPASIASVTPRTGMSLDGLFRQAQQANAVRQQAPDGQAIAGGNSDDTDSRTSVLASPADHWDPRFAHLRK